MVANIRTTVAHPNKTFRLALPASAGSKIAGISPITSTGNNFRISFASCKRSSITSKAPATTRPSDNPSPIPMTQNLVVKTMDSFDFLAIPSLNKARVLERARCEFLARRENVLLLGNSGTGKTHIALALGLAACQRGHRVRFTTTAALVSELIEARDEKKLLRFQKQIASYELLIVDELGFVP